MRNGMFLTKAPSNWQVLQRENGFAKVELEGYWVISCAQRFGKPLWRCAMCRVMLETDNSVVIPWTTCNFTTNADGLGGNFVASITLPQGGLYRIETALDTKNETEDMLLRGDCILHVAVGDLFVIAGQSNAAGFGKDSAPDPMHELVHVMRGDGKWDIAAHPIADSTNEPNLPSAELSVAGTSPFLSFGKTYLNETGVPVGLVPTARGGSAISRWDKKQDGELTENMELLFNKSGGKCAGILWYQGCSDTTAERAHNYFDAFKSMISEFRKITKEETPIFTIQLNKAQSDECDELWGILRQTQRECAQKINKVYIIPSLDIALCDRIHNSSSGNVIIGNRLGQICASVALGKAPQYAPDIKTAKAIKETIVLEFDNVVGVLQQFMGDEGVMGFSAQDEIGEIYFKKLSLQNNMVTLTANRKIAQNAKVSYAFEAYPLPVLLRDSSTYLPALSFYQVNVKNDD